MERLKIVIAGLAGAFPMAGSSLSWLQYVRGANALGHEVLYLEDTGAWYYDPSVDKVVENDEIPLRHLESIMAALDLSESWTFVNHRGETFGVSGRKLSEFLRDADLLIHVTGAMYLKDEYARIPRRAYVDTDPGFVQFRVANGSRKDKDHLEAHTSHFSFGCNIATPSCRIPTLGLRWHPTVQPLCLDLWPVAAEPRTDAPFTTIVKWAGYPAVEYDGESYGMKDVEFVKFVNLAGVSAQPMEMVMAGPAPVRDLESLGWRTRHSDTVRTVDAYRRYIHDSRGEWSVAKNGYVKTQGGWFSDRSAAYLASGRPVVLQSTGYERWLPSGKGLLPFTTFEEAVQALEAVNLDYKAHSQAARELAEAHFDSNKVLAALIDTAMCEA